MRDVSKKTLWFGLLIAAGCGREGASTSALQDAPGQFFDYTTGSVSASGASCESEAAAFGARFAAATGVTPYRTACAGDDGYARSLTLTYVAAAPLPVVSATRGRFWRTDASDTMPAVFPSNPLFGIFGDLATCLSATSVEESTFERETGLKAVAAYCVRADAGGIGLRVDGFGTPHRRFRQLEAEFYGAVDAALVDAVEGVVRHAAGDVVDGVPWGPNALVSYYAADSANVLTKTIGFEGQLDSMAECDSELAVAKAAIGRVSGASPVIARCLPNAYDSSAHLNFGFEGEEAKRFSQVEGPLYSTYAACVGDRERGRVAMSQASGREIAEAVCVRTSSVSPASLRLIGVAR